MTTYFRGRESAVYPTGTTAVFPEDGKPSKHVQAVKPPIPLKHTKASVQQELEMLVARAHRDGLAPATINILASHATGVLKTKMLAEILPDGSPALQHYLSIYKHDSLDSLLSAWAKRFYQ